MTDFDWQGDGPVFTIDSKGRSWTLKLDAARPSLEWSDGRSGARLLGLDHLAAGGLRDDSAFDGPSLVSFARHRARVEATFAPPEWPGLAVRAAWEPTPEHDGFDLEVQLWVTSTAVFRRVEVAIASTWADRAAEVPACNRYEVEPRDRHAAALSYDGREPRSLLQSLITMPVPATSPRMLPPKVYAVAWPDVGPCYVEMVQPNDCARRILGEEVAGETAPRGALCVRYGLFGHDLEKGVVLRGRVRGIWIESPSADEDARRHYEMFLREPPALGP